MKTILTYSVPFTLNAGTANSSTLDFSAVPNYNQKFLYAVTNNTTKQTVYATGQTGLTGSSVGSTLTLNLACAGMSASDSFTIIYDLSGIVTSANSTSVTPASDSTFTVSGASAVGSAPSLPPVAISGVDGGGLKRHLLMDTSGRPNVNINGTVSVSAASLPLPSGAATETTVAAINTKTPSLGAATTAASTPVTIATDLLSTVPAARNVSAQVVTPAQQKLFRTTFASVIASGVDSNFFTAIVTGSGQTVSQSAGNLVLTTGTTINSETILRSTQSFTGNMIARAQTILSQRIVNQNFFIELVDVIGDGLAATASSATSLTVTIPSNPFTSANVGQSMYIGNLAGGLVGVPNRYVIASVAGNNVTFTVAGFSVTSGTCSLFGWNYYQTTYNAAVATTSQYDAQRRGWNSGNTAITTNTTASPGHMLIMGNEDGNAYVADQLVATGTSVAVTQRGSRVVNLPEESTTLFLQIRSLNGSTAPASTTTWTIGMCSVENYSALPTSSYNVKIQNQSNQMPVSVTNTPAVTISSGTVTTVSTVTAVTTLASMTAGNLNIPGLIADVASAALTTTTTTATLTPTFGSSYQVNIPVTVVSGTSPTLDVQIQESDDTGTNWVPIYDFPRITATGMYRSPMFPLIGNRVRYVQTVGGTTPSFTRSINRLQSSLTTNNPLRQIIDRTVSLTTLNSTTPVLTLARTTNVQLVINLGAATTPPALQLEGSDDAGATWYAVGSPLTGVASSTVQVTVNNVSPQQLRARVSTVGATVTAGYVLIKGF